MAYRRIHISGGYKYEEYNCGEAITPGMLCELNSSGNAIKHAEQGGRCEKMFAVEDALQGSIVTTDYTASNQGCFILPYKGTVVAALIKGGEALAIGDEVVSAGDGTLQARGSSGSGVTEWETVGVMMEANSATANSLKKVRIV